MRLLYHKSCKKKSDKLWNSPPLCFAKNQTSEKDIIQRHLDRTNSISHIQHFINAFQSVAYRCPAVMRLCCNVRQREPLHVPQ